MYERKMSESCLVGELATVAMLIDLKENSRRFSRILGVPRSLLDKRFEETMRDNPWLDQTRVDFYVHCDLREYRAFLRLQLKNKKQRQREKGSDNRVKKAA